MAGNKTFPLLQQMPGGSLFHVSASQMFALDVHFANVVRSRLQYKISNRNV